MSDRTQIINSAQQFAARGQVDRAIETWQSLLAEAPNDGNIFNTVGDLYLRKNDPAKAIDAYIQAGNIFEAGGFELKAIAVYKKIIKLDPRRFDIIEQVGDLHAKRGFQGNAVEDYLRVAQNHAAAGDARSAFLIYQKILRLDRENVKLRRKIAEELVKAGLRTEGAAELVSVGELLAEQQHPSEAAEFFSRALEVNPQETRALSHLSRMGLATLDPQQRFAQAEEDFREGRIDEAERTLKTLVEKEPENSLYRARLAALLVFRGDLSAAFSHYREAAKTAAAAGDIRQAESLLRDYLAVDPHLLSARQMLAEIYESAGRTDDAVSQYGAMAEELLSQRLGEEAKTVLSKMQRLSSDHPAVGALSQKINSMSGSVSVPPPGIPSNAPQQDQEAAEGLLTEAEVYLKYGLFDRALKLYREVLEVNPNHRLAHEKLKELYEAEGLLDQAAQEAQTLSRLYGQADPARAREYSQEAISLNPRGGPVGGNPDFLYKKPTETEVLGGTPQIADQLAEAEFYIGQGMTEEAKKILREILAAHPPSSPQVERARERLIEIEAREGPQKDAPAVLAETIREGKSPSGTKADPGTHFGLGAAYREMGLLSEAISELSQAVSEDSKMHEAAILLAQCQREKGMTRAAIEILQEVIADSRAAAPVLLSARYELADLLELTEKKNEALTLWREIASAAPDFRDAARRLEKLSGTLKAAPLPRKDASKKRISYL